MLAITPFKEHRYRCGVGRGVTLMGPVAWPLALNSLLNLVRPFCGICWRNQSCIVELALDLETVKPPLVSRWLLWEHLVGSIPCHLEQQCRGPCAQAHRGHLKGVWLCEEAKPLKPHGVSLAAHVWPGGLGGNQYGARGLPEGCLHRRTLVSLSRRGNTS